MRNRGGMRATVDGLHPLRRVPWTSTGWRSELVVWLIAASLGAVAAWLLGSERLYHWRTDLQVASVASTQPSDRVLVIDIDEASVRALRSRFGPWPLSRDAYALLGGYLFDAGASAVVFDILFADERAGDEAFRQFLETAPGPVILSAGSTTGSLGTSSGDPTERSVGPVLPVGCPVEQWSGVAGPVWGEPSAGSPLGAHVEARVGMISLPLDADGVLRGLPLLHAGPARLWPVLPLATWLALHNQGVESLRCHAGVARAVGGPSWPIDEAGRVILRPPAHEGRPEQIGFGEVMRAALGTGGNQEAAMRDRIRGRVVVVGASAGSTSGVHGVVLTPVGQMGAPALFATAYAALEDNALLRPPRASINGAWMLLTLLPPLMAARRRSLAPSQDLGWLVVALALLLCADLLAVAWFDQLSQVAWPVFTLIVLGALSALRWRGAQSALQGRLEHAREAAEQASALKSEFLAHMSHEIRTPMNALLGSAELLAASPLDVQQRRHVELFRAAGGHLMEILNDLLDLSKIEAGQLDLSARPFSLQQLLEAQIELFEAQAAQRGLALRIAADPALPEVVVGDPKRLSQVLRNLVSNAVKFTAHGSVTLAVARAGGDRLRFEVRDTGIGIPPKRLAAIFQPFTQSDSSITRRYGGTGLGLTISKRLVEMMGGGIDVQSEEGRGSRFGFEVSLEASEEPPVSDWNVADHHDVATPGRALSVLLADDNHYNVMLVEAFLDGGGHRIDVVGNGVEAVEAALHQSYDVVLMDVQMPQMDGYAATGAIRQHEREHRLQAVPIIALTANAQAGEAEIAMQHGCTDYLAKPFTRVQLLALLAQHAGVPPQPTPYGGRGARRAPVSLPPVERPLPAAVSRDDPRVARLAALAGRDVEAARERLRDQPGLYEKVLDEATGSLVAFDRRMDDALMLGDHVLALRLAHDLKGLSRTIGASALADTARTLELGLRRQVDEEALRVLRADVRERLARCLDALTDDR